MMLENTVSMLLEALTTIIHTINHPSPTPAPCYHHNHLNPHHELTRNRTLYQGPRENNNYHRGNGWGNGRNCNGGRNGGDGGIRQHSYQGHGGHIRGNGRGCLVGKELLELAVLASHVICLYDCGNFCSSI